MSKKYATPLLLEVRPSKMMTAWLVFTHGLALLVPVLLDAPVLLSVLLAASILISLRRSYQLQASRSHPDAICRLLWEAGDECLLTRRSGKQRTVILKPRAFVMPWLVVLQLRIPHGPSCCLALLPDMLNSEVFRRLRVRLIIEIQHIGTRAA